MQPARARADLDRVQRRRLVDQDRRLVEAAERGRELLPVLRREAAGAQLVLVEAPDRADQPQRELRGAHFHREDDDRQPGRERDVLADVERERGLAHARPSGDDDEVARLQAGGHPVEIAEAGRHAGDVRRIVAVVERLDAIDDAREQRSDRRDLLRAARRPAPRCAAPWPRPGRALPSRCARAGCRRRRRCRRPSPRAGAGSSDRGRSARSGGCWPRSARWRPARRDTTGRRRSRASAWTRATRTP